MKTTSPVYKGEKIINSTYSKKTVKPLSFDEMLESVKDIKPPKNPIKEIRMGKKLFTGLSKATTIVKRKAKYVGEIYGIKIREDKTLKPNQYRIIRDFTL